MEITAQSKVWRGPFFLNKTAQLLSPFSFRTYLGVVGVVGWHWFPGWHLERKHVFFFRKKEEKGAVIQEKGIKDDVGPRGSQCSFQVRKYTRRYGFPSKRSRVGLGEWKGETIPYFLY